VASYQRDALACLRRAFKADAACFFVYGESTDSDTHWAGTPLDIDFDAFVAENLDGETGPLYQSHYGSVDPFAKALAQLGARIAPLATAGDALFEARSTWERTEFYADFMRPRNVHHLLCLRLVDGHRVSGLVSLYRAARGPRFDERTIDEAQLFAPALTSGLSRIRTNRRLDGCRTLIEGFERLAPEQGILLVDQDGNWRAASPRLERWLSRGESIQLSRFRAQLSARVLKMLANRGNSPDMETLRDGEGRLVRLRALQERTPLWADDPGHIFLIEPVERDDAIARNAHAAGLSRRQHQVTALLVEGLSSAEIADRLCLSRATVNNHIRAIYARASVNSRGKLIAKMQADC